MNILVSLDSRTLPVTNKNVLALDSPFILSIAFFEKQIEPHIQLLGFVQCFSAGYCVYCIFAMKKTNQVYKLWALFLALASSLLVLQSHWIVQAFLPFLIQLCLLHAYRQK